MIPIQDSNSKTVAVDDVRAGNGIEEENGSRMYTLSWIYVSIFPVLSPSSLSSKIYSKEVYALLITTD